MHYALSLQSCDSSMVVKENPERKKKGKMESSSVNNCRIFRIKKAKFSGYYFFRKTNA